MAIEPAASLNTGGSRAAKRVVMRAHTANDWEWKFMLAILYTGVSSCLISEHVVTDRFSMEEVDATKREELRFSDGALVETLGQLTLSIQLDPINTGDSQDSMSKEVIFMVIPTIHVAYRYDALLSDDVLSAFGNRCVERALDNMADRS
jgi:hypothetical protein